MRRIENNNQTLKSKSSAKRKEKPEWVSTFVDRDSYKLTPSELMQKKISLISKHQIEAKDEWKNLQEKLKKGVVDDDTSKIFKTAQSAKGLGYDKYGVTRRNLTQMMHLETTLKSETQETFQNDEYNENLNDIYNNNEEDILERAKNILNNNPKHQDEFLSSIQKDLHETRQLIRIVDKNSNSKKKGENTEKLLHQLKQLSNKKENKENLNPSLKNLKVVQNQLDTSLNKIQPIIKNSEKVQNKYKNILDDPQLKQKEFFGQNLGLDNTPASSQLSINDMVKQKKIDYSKEIEEFEKQMQNQNRVYLKNEDLFQPISPSKFFQDSVELNEPSTIHHNELPTTEIKYEEADFLDLESIRRMLEDTKIALDKMNLRGDDFQPLNEQQDKQDFQQNRNLIPCKLDYDDEIHPRSFTITQHKLDIKSQNLKQHTFMIKNNNYI